jgi:hypothetical protein
LVGPRIKLTQLANASATTAGAPLGSSTQADEFGNPELFVRVKLSRHLVMAKQQMKRALRCIPSHSTFVYAGHLLGVWPESYGG